jgi:hypothetical protein
MFFNDLQASNALRVNFLKNKQSLEEVTCSLSGIEHDGSKTWGEDGYYKGNKVEIKNVTYTGKQKINGRVKFHDLNKNRVNEFITEPYWLVLGCYNYLSAGPGMNEIVFGFLIDNKITDTLLTKIDSGKSDPEISLTTYEHLFKDNKVHIFRKNNIIHPQAYSPKLYNCIKSII